MNLIRGWIRHYFNDPQIIILSVLLISGIAVIWLMGGILAPVLASVVVAYLLEGLVGVFQRLRLPRIAAVLIVFLSFMAFLIFLLVGLLPTLSLQVGEVVTELPTIISRGQKQLMLLPERYPDFISKEQLAPLMNILQTEMVRLGQRLLTFSVASVRGFVTFLVYIVLMPLLVFFFLKDKEKLLSWITNFLPRDRKLSVQVWREVDLQIGNYTRGKFWEILIVWSTSYITFYLLGLNFAILLGLLVGFSVLVPYVGATAATFPVALIAFYQWGWGSEFMYVLISYAIIQLLD